MPDVTRIPLKRALLLQRSYLVLSLDGVTVDLRGWGRVFRTPWLLPRTGVTVAARTIDPGLAPARSGSVWCRPLVVPTLTSPKHGNLTLLFEEPRRISPIRRTFAYEIGWRSRKRGGLDVDGVMLSAVDPVLVCEQLAAHGWGVTDTPEAWLRQRRPVTDDAAAVEAVRVGAVWRRRISLVQGILILAALIGLHLFGDSVMRLAVAGAALVGTVRAGRCLAEYVDRRERRMSGQQPAE